MTWKSSYLSLIESEDLRDEKVVPNPPILDVIRENYGVFSPEHVLQDVAASGRRENVIQDMGSWLSQEPDDVQEESFDDYIQWRTKLLNSKKYGAAVTAKSIRGTWIKE